MYFTLQLEALVISIFHATKNSWYGLATRVVVILQALALIYYVLMTRSTIFYGCRIGFLCVIKQRISPKQDKVSNNP